MTDIRLWRFALSCCAILFGVLCAGCGGGATGEASPPPPLPDFTLSISPSSTTISQGSTSPAIQVGVQSLNGFSGDVQVTLSGMPSGVTANPQSPFTVTSGGSATLLLGASQAAAIGNSAIAVPGSSGALTHSSSIALTVQRGTATAVSRTTYTRTDAQSALDDPAGEPHHRHMAYDSANRRLLVANRARNRVEILSTLDGSRAGTVDVAGASSVDISSDGKNIWVGTFTEQIAAIDTAGLQRTNTIGTITPASGSSSGGATLTIRGSGFQAGATAAIGGKSVAVTFVDMNTLKVATPALNAGKYRVAVTNPDGETASLDATFAAN